jgi:hypothetical protein
MRDDSQRCVGPPSQLECLHQNADFTPEPRLHNRTRLYNRTRTSQPRLHSRIQTPWHARTDLKSSSAHTVGAHRNMSREPRTQVSLRVSRQRRPRHRAATVDSRQCTEKPGPGRQRTCDGESAPSQGHPCHVADLNYKWPQSVEDCSGAVLRPEWHPMQGCGVDAQSRLRKGPLSAQDRGAFTTYYKTASEPRVRSQAKKHDFGLLYRFSA